MSDPFSHVLYAGTSLNARTALNDSVMDDPRGAENSNQYQKLLFSNTAPGTALWRCLKDIEDRKERLRQVLEKENNLDTQDIDKSLGEIRQLEPMVELLRAGLLTYRNGLTSIRSMIQSLEEIQLRALISPRLVSDEATKATSVAAWNFLRNETAVELKSLCARAASISSINDALSSKIAILEGELDGWNSVLSLSKASFHHSTCYVDASKPCSQALSSLLSVVRRVPTDIWSMVFGFYMDDLLEHSEVNYTRRNRVLGSTAILLSQVCRQWRDIAHSMPRLWSNIGVYLRGWWPQPRIDCFEYVLLKTKQKPLHLTMCPDSWSEWDIYRGPTDIPFGPAFTTTLPDSDDESEDMTLKGRVARYPRRFSTVKKEKPGMNIQKACHLQFILPTENHHWTSHMPPPPVKNPVSLSLKSGSMLEEIVETTILARSVSWLTSVENLSFINVLPVEVDPDLRYILPSIKTLRLQFYCPRPFDIRRLIEPYLEELYFWQSGTGEFGSLHENIDLPVLHTLAVTPKERILLEYLTMPSLQTFIYYGTSINHGFDEVNPSLGFNSLLSTITSLKIVDWTWKPEGRRVVNMVKSMIARAPKLEVVEFQSCFLDGPRLANDLQSKWLGRPLGESKTIIFDRCEGVTETDCQDIRTVVNCVKVIS